MCYSFYLNENVEPKKLYRERAIFNFKEPLMISKDI